MHGTIGSRKAENVGLGVVEASRKKAGVGDLKEKAVG
jgi:hypothetical protein